MKQQEAMAELAYIRATHCDGKDIHEFYKNCIALELAASYCDDQGNIILVEQVQNLLNKLR